MTSPFNFIDLFSGIGGFALGAEWAGLHFNGHYYSEVAPYAIKVYGKRFPEAVALGDIRDIRGADLPKGEWIIAGGFPCQDISTAGKGAGLDGARSGLWFEYARLIGELRPRYAIMENVGALVVRGLDRVLGSLAALGYDAEWQDIRASDVGAPHRRSRIWIVAYPQRERVRDQQGRSGTILADADEIFRDGGRGARDGRAEPTNGGPEVSDSNCSWELQQERGVRQKWGRVGNGNWWETEPDVGRVANGKPSRMDRLKCLGNSIVPQIAERIFREIR